MILIFVDICEPLAADIFDSSHNGTPEDILKIRERGSKDGFCEIRIYDNKTIAIAAFYPPITEGERLYLDTITRFLKANNILYGVKWDTIEQVLEYATVQKREIANVVIAIGKNPLATVPDHYVIRKDLENFKIEIDTNADRIDWRSLSTFLVIKEKEIIARFFPSKEGEKGCTIYNETLDYGTEQVKIYKAGLNVLAHRTGLFALKDGHLIIEEDGTVNVNEVLILKKGVDFATGNITFPGDVINEGSIADGFKIFAGKSLLSKTLIDVSEVVVKQDVLAPTGIIGRFQGKMRVGGSLTTKFIENCHVIVRNDVIISGSIVKSTVMTMGMLKMEDKTRLLTSQITAVNGVQAWDIGSESSSPVKIICGVDFASKQELESSNEAIKSITMKIQKLEEENAHTSNDERSLFIMKLKTKKSELIYHITQLITTLDKNEDAVIRVNHAVYPGTVIEICRSCYTVINMLTAVEFYLDKCKGMVLYRSLKEKR